MTIPGVSPNATSTFTVAAVNTVGRGAAALVKLVPDGTPTAPGEVSVRADGQGRFLVKWAAATPRGARVTGYTVTAAPSRVRVAVSAGATSAVVTGLAGGAAYVPCVTATSSAGATAESCAGPLLVGSGGAVAQATAVTPGSLFTPVSPVRLMDTRSGTGGVTGPVAADKSVALQVAGVDGVPSSGVSAVVLNVTVTQPSVGGVLTVYPDGGAVPGVSNLNFGAGETVPNLVIVKLGSDGKVDFYNNSSGTVHILADLAGYYSASGSSFTPVSPVRLMDTRSGTGGVTGPVAADKSVALQVAGVDGVPSSGVTAVVMNVTVVSPSAGGLLTVYPDGGAVPGVSNLNFGAGETVPNLVTVEVGSDGKVDFYNGASGTTQVVADLAGYYSASGSSFTPVSPVRLMDTRNGTGGVTGPVAADKSVALQVAGVDGVPSSGVTAVVLNVTVTQPTVGGVLTVYPDGGAVPGVSNLNFGAGETVPNLVIVKLGSDGKVDFYNNSSGTVHILADLAGYYVAPLGAPTTVTAAAGNAQATVSWTAPQWDGGYPVTGYTVTASNGASVSAAASATSATVTGLANGTSYTFTVTAANSTGSGPASATSNAVTPSAPPGAPTGVTATGGNGQATVTWTAPAATGGGAITSYKVAASPGSAAVTVAGTVTTATVTGLANGTAYTFTVIAATVGGSGPASAASNAVTPMTVPGAPTGVTATAGNGQATVTWTAPALNGGSAVTGYTVTASDGITATAAATATSATVKGLANGTAYTFTVTATNAAGASAASAASNAVTPVGPPEAPDLTGWTVGNGQVTLDWQAPASDGGEAVTGYTITMEPGGSTHTAAATATSLTVTGLTDGTSYSFSITATNALGTGPASDAVGPVIPITVPGAPTGVTATAASGSATVTWTAPATEGSEVTGYTVTAAPGGASVTVPGNATSATVTGLTNGTAYTFTVTAADAAGPGTVSAPSAAVTPGPVPAPPVDVQATTGNATATVTWPAPASAGGSAITSYIVTAEPGGATVTVSGTTLTATFTGLTNNTAYQFTVVAVNSYGDSAPSGASPSVTPTAPAPPDAPFITNVTGEDSAVEVTWAPPDTGTADLTGYTLTASAGGSTVSTTSEPATATEATVTGLTNGTQYTFTITAQNAAGTGTASPPSVPVAPLPATAPMAPANVIAVPQNGQLQVGWAAPPDGGSPITGYTVTVSPATIPATSVAAGTTVATLTGLTNGTAYTVSVTTTNKAGTSPAAQAGPATPAAVIAPGAPASVIGSVTASGTVSVSWTPPMTPGTATITGYTVRASAGSSVAATVAAGTSACTGTPARCTAPVTGLTAATAYTFTVTATSSAGTGPASPATDAITPTLTVATAPVKLSAADAATLRYVNTDGTLIFEQPSSAVTGLTARELVYVPATAAEPDGFLGKVDSVTTQGGFVDVATSPANLSSVYSAYDASMNVPFNGADAQLVNAVPGVSVSRPELGGRTLTSSASSGAGSPEDSPFSVSFDNDSLVLALDVDLSQGDTEDGSGSTPALSPSAHLEGTLTLTPITQVNLSGGTLGFTIGGNLNAQVDTKVGVQVSTSEKIFLGKVLGPVVDVQVGELPVPSQIVYTLYAVLTASGTIGVEYQADYSHTLAAVCQVNLIGGGSCQPDDADNSHSGGLSAGHTIYGSMSASAGLQFGASLQIAFVAGPEVDLAPQVQVTADTSANPWWTLDLLGTLGVSVTMNEVWGNGDTIYSDPSLFTFGPLNLANAGGPLTGLNISPGQASVATGSTQQFNAYDYSQGSGTPVAATWAVVAGPGSVSSSGVFTAPSTTGVSIVQATYNGLTARASVITGSALPSDNVSGSLTNARGLVDAAEVDWAGMVIPAGASGFAVTAQPGEAPLGGGASSGGSDEAVYLPGTATHAYLPNLLPGVSYTLTVYTVGTGGGIIGSALGIIPLSPLPPTGNVHDVATNPTTGKPDDTGEAGGENGGASISGNGVYAFFYTQARSNLAPASIYNPASSDIYLVRKDLLTGEIDVASVGTDGRTPVPVAFNFPVISSFTNEGMPLASEDGSSVVFYTLNAAGDVQPEVYDLTTQTGWVVGTAGDSYDLVDGISSNGQVVAYNTDTTATPHVYRQAEGSAPQQIDSCPTDTTDTCSDGTDVSMSADGNLIAYTAEDQNIQEVGQADDIYLYSAITGSETAVFPRTLCYDGATIVWQCDSYYDPVLSGDGSTLAFELEPYGATGGGYSSLALIRVGSQDKTVIATDYANDASDTYQPVALSGNGDVLLYSALDSTAVMQDKLLAYGTGASQAPQLGSGSNPTTLWSASLSANGNEVVYTLNQAGYILPTKYPGVYLWTP